MRVFKNELMWDKVEQQWFNSFSVDGEICSQDEYYREIETEQCLENDEEIETFCECCECGSEDCENFDCTCDDLEVEEGNTQEYFDEDDEELCFCEHCNEPREQELIKECLDFVFDPCCSEGIVDMVISTLFKFKELGKLEAKQDMKYFLED